jgi:hypothetical protein
MPFEIREHGFSFMQCNLCGHILGGEKEEAKIHKYMKIKVRPTIRPSRW